LVWRSLGKCFQLHRGHHLTEQVPRFNLIVLRLGPRTSIVDNSTQRRRANPLEKIAGHIAAALRMTRNT
jgi:hypothetical protein